jgi:DNA gyrase subunit A
MGRHGIVRGYLGERSRITLRARAEVVDEGKTPYILIKEVPYQVTRNKLMEEIASAARDGGKDAPARVAGIAAVTDESSARSGEPVRIVVELKRGVDPYLVLNQLYQYTTLQKTISIGMLALVDGRPQFLSLKEMMQKFLDHRVQVIRRRTQFLLREAKRRGHVLEGQLIAISSIEEVIHICRTSPSRAEAKQRLQGMEVAASVMRRAIGEAAFDALAAELGLSDVYRMTEAQAEAVVRLQLGQLAALESDEILKEYTQLREEIRSYEELLGDDRRVNAVIRSDLEQIRDKYGDARRTEITDDDADVNLEDLIPDEPNVVTISHEGFLKRMPIDTYRVQHRGGKGVSGGLRENDFIEHFFVASTHAYVLCFTDRGQVYWLRVFNIPQATRTSSGRSIANVLSLRPDEKLTSVIPVRRFEGGYHLMMATRNGLVKKSSLIDYSRPRAGGIIGIVLEEGDALIHVALTRPGDEVVLSTRNGMAIRFSEADVREMGRVAKGVKGITLSPGDYVVGMVVADPEGYLLTICERGYGKRTPFGANTDLAAIAHDADEDPFVEATSEGDKSGDTETTADAELPQNGDETSLDRSAMRYRLQRRGGKGVKDVRTSERNGPVVGIAAVRDGDEVMLITLQGMVTRCKVDDIRIVGRNTQGVRVMNLNENDRIAVIAKVAQENLSSPATES